MRSLIVSCALLVLGALSLPLLLPEAIILGYAQQVAQAQNLQLDWQAIRWRLLPRPSAEIENFYIQQANQLEAQNLIVDFRWLDFLQGQPLPYHIQASNLTLAFYKKPARRITIANANITMKKKGEYISLIIDAKEFYKGMLHGEADILVRSNNSLGPFTANYQFRDIALSPLMKDLQLPPLQGQLSAQGNMRGTQWQRAAVQSLTGDGELAITQLEVTLIPLLGFSKTKGDIAGSYKIANGIVQAPKLEGRVGDDIFHLGASYHIDDEQIWGRIAHSKNNNAMEIRGSLNNPQITFNLNPALENQLRERIRGAFIR